MKIFAIIAICFASHQVLSAMKITGEKARNLYQILPVTAVPMGLPIEILAVKIYGTEVRCAWQNLEGMSTYKCLLEVNTLDQCNLTGEQAQGLFDAMKGKPETWISDHNGLIWIRKESPISCTMKVYYKVEDGKSEYSCTISDF